MLMTAKTVVCIAVLITLCSGEKKVLKSKHERTLAQKPAKEKQGKNGKRWMGGFTQTYVTPNADLGPGGGGGNEFGGPMGPVQYPNQFNPQPDPTFGSLNEEAMSYVFGGGFKEPQMNAAGPMVSPMQSPVKEPSLQGMEEMKINKQPSFVNPDEQLGFASEVASYLKPGIGDFPSDMPGSMANVNGMTAIGMPLQMKPKAVHMNPTVQSQSKLMQTALEDAALNPAAMHKNQNTLTQGNAALTQAAENLDATELLGNEPPAKILSAAPSPLPLDENSTATLVANDNDAKIDKEEAAKEAADASPSPEEKVTDKPDVEASEKPETDKIEQEAKAEAKIETKTEAKLDSKPTPKIEAKEESKEETKVTKEKGADDVGKDTNSTLETETTKEKETVEEKQVETETAKESPKPAAAKDDGKQKSAEEKEKPSKVKETAANVETADSSKVSKAQKPEKSPATDVPGAMKLVKSKHKVETGARRQNWDRVVDTGHNRLEPVGLPEENSIAAFENGNGIEEAGVDDNGESIGTMEVGDEEDNITPSRVKAKLVTSLKQALLQNSKAMMGKGAGKEEEDTSDDSVSDFEGKGAKEDDTDTNDNAETEEVSGNEKSDLLEQNLMKIDKKKLVHLLANMMRKNREKEAEGGSNENEQFESAGATAGIDKDEKGSEESTKGNGKETAEANEKTSKLSPKNENDGEDYQPKIAKIKHQQKAGSRHTQYDPYTQIGLTDPTNSQQDHVSKHATHGKHEEKPDKEELEKEKKLSQVLKIKKLVAASKESEKEDKAGLEDKDEKEEIKEEKEEAKEHMEDAKEEKKEELKDEKEEKEEAKEEEKEEAKEENKILEKAVKEADKKEEDTIKEKIKEIKEKQKEKEEEKAEAEEIQVEAQVEKERQELKKLKEEEKQEKEKENQLKAENAQLMAENESDKEEEEKSEEGDDSEMVKDDTKLKEAQQAIYHLVNPSMVNNIVESVQNAHPDKEREENASEEETDSKMVTVNEEKVNTGHAVKLAAKVKDKEKEIQELIKEKNKDKLKDEKGSIQKEEKTSPSKTEEETNLQTLINRVKEKLGSSKQAKQLLKSNPKEKELIKVKHTKKGFFDDAYAQIGSSDPNVKKRKTITTIKDKKRRLHNRSKVTKHQ